MIDTFRVLCAELVMSWDVDGCDWKPRHQAAWNATVERARAALAAEEEPEVVGELTDQELLRCAKIATPCYNLEAWERELRMMRAAIAADRARHCHQPEPPAEGEVAELPPRPPLMEPPAHPALERYGVTWDGSPDKPLLTRRADGYWTPWHIAADLLERLAPQREEVERQTPAEYNLRLADAAQAAGVGDYYWNERFLSALRNRGLELSVQHPANDHNNHYPNGAPMLAPHPYPGGAFAWPLDYLIVWSQPVPEGPTDEELNAIWNCCGIADEYGNHTGNIFEFARAVLQKWGRQ